MVCAVIALVASLASPEPAWAAPESPQALLSSWQAALAEDDYAAYRACLHSAARAVPEYGSREAMQFWAREVERLRDRGFDGRFDFEVVTEGRARLPAGALLARPILAGTPMRDAIVLVREAGGWKILRLFS